MEPLIPDYDGACISNLVPEILSGDHPDWFPSSIEGASPVFLFVIDGMGWAAIEEHRDQLPALSSLEGGSITSVVPSSTASALTSITTGTPPAAHGLVGYRMKVGPQMLNVLNWALQGGGDDDPPDPESLQRRPAFGGRMIKTVTRSAFIKSGFSKAHMKGATVIGWKATSTLVEHARRLSDTDDPLVYLYYDGPDLVAHNYGIQNEFFLNELKAADRLVADLLDVLPQQAGLLVCADHGQVQLTRDSWIELGDCSKYIAAQGGDARFRYLYSKRGEEQALYDAARLAVGDFGWVLKRDDLLQKGWMGQLGSQEIASRIGDVVIAARGSSAFVDPAMSREVNLQSGHGSLTAEEMLVPLLGGRGSGG